ncbi:MAG: cation:proton antiporter [Saprospiraceae bacterium]|nr:cation:proton antiporter [Saprospiraceae bacterium]
MTATVLISICALLLFAYIFDITSAKTKVPSVILLLLLGWTAKLATQFSGLTVPNLQSILPILGTTGLILIVLEGSLELDLDKSKFKLIAKATVVAVVPMVLLAVGMAFLFQYIEQTSFKIALGNALPLAIISSAIAIPSARHLPKKDKEFITYESSLSDIVGIILFNFVTLNDNIEANSVGHFFLELFLMLVVSFVATLGLALLLSKIKHHVKFTPIIILIILIYAISKLYHLPALIFILLFGLFLGNLDRLRHIELINVLHPEVLEREVHKFKELTAEMTFLIRALFFLLFGFLIESAELFNAQTISWAILITVAIFILRFISLKLMKLPMPLLYIAPRGLITILLFLSIPEAQQMLLVNKSLILQIIILTAFVMMFGLMKGKKEVKETTQEDDETPKPSAIY